MSPKILILAVAASLCTGSVAFGDESGQRPRPRPQQQQQIPDDYDEYDQGQQQGYQEQGYGYQQQGYAYGYQQQGCQPRCGAPAVLPMPGYGYPRPHVGVCFIVYSRWGWQIMLNGIPTVRGQNLGDLGMARQQFTVSGRCIFSN